MTETDFNIVDEFLYNESEGLMKEISFELTDEKHRELVKITDEIIISCVS